MNPVGGLGASAGSLFLSASNRLLNAVDYSASPDGLLDATLEFQRAKVEAAIGIRIMQTQDRVLQDILDIFV